MAGRKATKFEIMQRLQTLEELLVQGATYSDIVRYTAANWELSRSMTEKYLSKIYKRWKDYHERRQQAALDIAIQRRERLYQTAMNGKDYREARRVQDSLDKVTGVTKDVIEHRGIPGSGGPGGQPREDLSIYTTEELLKMREIQAAAQARKAQNPEASDAENEESLDDLDPAPDNSGSDGSSSN